MKDKGKILFSAQRQVVRRRVKFFQRILSVCLLVCVAYLAWYRWDSMMAAKKNRKLQQIAWQTGQEQAESLHTEDGPVSGQTDSRNSQDGRNGTGEEMSGPEAENAEEEKKSPNREGFETLLGINPDLRAWISIPDTTLSLPVVQGSDNSYYLGHDFYGAQDRHGTIFMDCSADLDGGTSNIVIYGHHMRDGSMFGILKEYRNESFYREHPSFFLTLPEEEREYEILAVVRNDIFEGNREDFQYYDYKRIEDEEAFDAYCQAVKENARYETGVEAVSGDELVTLCTCDYGSSDQRLLVVGKKKVEETAVDNSQ